MTVTSLEEIKSHLAITTHDDDTLLNLKIETAESLVESYTGRKFAEFYDSAEDVYSVPAPMLEAVRQITASLYENREGGLDYSPSVLALMAPYRLWSF